MIQTVLALATGDIGSWLGNLGSGAEHLLAQQLNQPGPLSFITVALLGLLVSLGPCSVSLLPVTMAFLAGTSRTTTRPWRRSCGFALGIVAALTVLGLISSLLGRVYGQVPGLVPVLVAVLAIVMGLNLLGLLPIRLPAGPAFDRLGSRLPSAVATVSAGFAFGLAASPCTTPVLAVLLTWVGGAGRPLLGAFYLAAFGVGQVLPLLLVGTVAAALPRLLALRSLSRWLPTLSGTALVGLGSLMLLSRVP